MQRHSTANVTSQNSYPIVLGISAESRPISDLFSRWEQCLLGSRTRCSGVADTVCCRPIDPEGFVCSTRLISGDFQVAEAAVRGCRLHCCNSTIDPVRCLREFHLPATVAVGCWQLQDANRDSCATAIESSRGCDFLDFYCRDALPWMHYWLEAAFLDMHCRKASEGPGTSGLAIGQRTGFSPICPAAFVPLVVHIIAACNS
ncbi:hypothetical protein F5884DRAFT_29184 [Xylogone sp. PMI_703]|nr:hypothetical protein F5884DRAFT_29184 [Xylogone sp. PMI_703]